MHMIRWTLRYLSLSFYCHITNYATITAYKYVTKLFLLVGLRENSWPLLVFFLPPLSNQTHFPTIFFLIFLVSFFIHPKILPTKHTINLPKCLNKMGSKYNFLLKVYSIYLSSNPILCIWQKLSLNKQVQLFFITIFRIQLPN